MEMLFSNKKKQDVFVGNLGQSLRSASTSARMDSNTGFIAFITVFLAVYCLLFRLSYTGVMNNL